MALKGMVNSWAIGNGIYDSLSEDDQAVIAFGMTPKWLIDDVNKKIRRKLGEITAEKWECPGDEEAIEMFAASVKPNVMNEIEKEFVLGLFDAAKEAGKLIV